MPGTICAKPVLVLTCKGFRRRGLGTGRLVTLPVVAEYWNSTYYWSTQSTALLCMNICILENMRRHSRYHIDKEQDRK